MSRVIRPGLRRGNDAGDSYLPQFGPTKLSRYHELILLDQFSTLLPSTDPSLEVLVGQRLVRTRRGHVKVVEVLVPATTQRAARHAGDESLQPSASSSTSACDTTTNSRYKKNEVKRISQNCNI